MSRSRALAVVIAVALLGLTVAGPVANAKENELAPKHVLKSFANGAPDQGDKGDAGPKGAKATNNGISYHGGPVMVAPTTNAYIIWYGNWAGSSATTILQDLLTNIGGSPYFNINTTYANGSGAKVHNSVTYVSSTTDNAHGTSLSDSTVTTIVSDAVTSGRLPKDPDGVYFVLTAAGVAETSGFLTQYCGWHTHASIAGTDLKYAFIGDPTGPKLSACAVQTTTSPNGNIGADAMASVIAHELEEAVTDPDLNAWYDSRGYETADKCAWTFGTTFKAANGSAYNMTLGSRQYLIQRNWVNASGGSCAVKYP